MHNLLITGATGFVGRALLTGLQGQSGIVTRAAIRESTTDLHGEVECFEVGEINSATDWTASLADVDLVVHAAARAHRPRERGIDLLDCYREVNTAGTLKLARQAVSAGVRRFVFLSSIGVVASKSDKPLDEAAPLRPTTPYAISKLEAEQGLQQIARETALEIVIIRPPLIYGANAPGNFARLVGLIGQGIPLPLAGIDNRRSLIGIDNLVDFIQLCLVHPAAAGQTFHVCDAGDVSTPELLRLVGEGLGKPARLVWVPRFLLRLGAALTGKRSEYDSLCGNLRVDNARATQLLGWKPTVSTEQGVRRAVSGT